MILSNVSGTFGTTCAVSCRRFEKATVQDKTQQGHLKNGTQTRRKQLNDTTQITDSTPQKSPIRKVLTTRMTHKGDNGHQTPLENSRHLKQTITGI